MEIYLKKYFWVVHVLVIVTCALLAAKGVNHIVEATYLLDGNPAKAVRRARPKLPDKPKPTATKQGSLVVTRNMFCSTCEPPEPQTAVASAQPSDPDHPPATSLPLSLLATNVATDELLSSATISNTQSLRSGSYWIHEDIPDAGEIVRIEPRFVDFVNPTANRVERIDLLGMAAAGPSPARPSPPPARPAARPGDDFLAAMDSGVRKVDETHYEIDRALIDRALTDPNVIARSARIVPSIKDGKANGFKMYAIRPNSVYARIGFQNGDTIHAINGFEMTSPDKALEVYTKVKSATHLSIQVTRRGSEVTMDYSIK